MPRYSIYSKIDDEENDIDCTYEELIEILTDKNFQQVFKSLNIGYRIGKLPVSDAWRSKLKAIKKANRNSTIEIP